jgi:hypothetical protein
MWWNFCSHGGHMDSFGLLDCWRFLTTLLGDTLAPRSYRMPLILRSWVRGGWYVQVWSAPTYYQHSLSTGSRVRCIPVVGRELSDKCQIAAHWALMNFCQDCEAKINNTRARFFPVMDQTSLIWHKKIKAMEKVEPRSRVYPLMTTAKYLHALTFSTKIKNESWRYEPLKSRRQKLKYER